MPLPGQGRTADQRHRQRRPPGPPRGRPPPVQRAPHRRAAIRAHRHAPPTHTAIIRPMPAAHRKAATTNAREVPPPQYAPATVGTKPAIYRELSSLIKTAARSCPPVRGRVLMLPAATARAAIAAAAPAKNGARGPSESAREDAIGAPPEVPPSRTSANR